jgi:hypothetical protein
MRAHNVVFGLSILLGACAGYAPPVPVSGESVRLEGRWSGTYENLMLERSGSIDFILPSGTDTARGSVLMVPEQPDRRILGTRYPEGYQVPEAPRLLEIVMVRVTDNRVSGRLVRYLDPDTGDLVETTFSGYLSGDVIDGKFFTVEVNGAWAAEGRWRVTRQGGR